LAGNRIYNKWIPDQVQHDVVRNDGVVLEKKGRCRKSRSNGIGQGTIEISADRAGAYCANDLDGGIGKEELD
jgi:hypothetical protein